MVLGEFDIIKKYFQQPQPVRKDVIVGSGDDCAVLAPPVGQELVMTVDTLVSGRHFLPSVNPADLAYKSVAVSLSDVAAMGGEPAWLLGALSMESADESWIKSFAEGLFAVVNEYGIVLVGGDLTRGPLSVTLQLTGFVPKGQAIPRSGAKVGDKIYVTGTLGDAGLALSHQLGKRQLDPATQQSVYPRLLRPTPRVAEGLALRGVASSAIDLSDGLVADLGHILELSGVGAKVTMDSLPLSPSLRALPCEDAWNLALSSGDDYELCFTLSPEQESKMKAALPAASSVTYIGEIVAKTGLEFFKMDGTEFQCHTRGYLHF